MIKFLTPLLMGIMGGFICGWLTPGILYFIIGDIALSNATLLASISGIVVFLLIFLSLSRFTKNS